MGPAPTITLRLLLAIFFCLTSLKEVQANSTADVRATKILATVNGGALGAGLGLLIWDPYRSHRQDVEEGRRPLPDPLIYCIPSISSTVAGLALGMWIGPKLNPSEQTQGIETVSLALLVLTDVVLMTALTRPAPDGQDRYDQEPPYDINPKFPGVSRQASPLNATQWMQLSFRF